MSTINKAPQPSGELTLQTVAMPKDTNVNGDIFGGWLLSQMDLAGSILAARIARGKIATVAISEMAFLRPVPVGAVVSCYAELLETGSSSMRISVEVWIHSQLSTSSAKVTEGEFVYVAISADGKTRAI